MKTRSRKATATESPPTLTNGQLTDLLVETFKHNAREPPTTEANHSPPRAERFVDSDLRRRMSVKTPPELLPVIRIAPEVCLLLSFVGTSNATLIALFFAGCAAELWCSAAGDVMLFLVTSTVAFVTLFIGWALATEHVKENPDTAWRAAGASVIMATLLAIIAAFSTGLLLSRAYYEAYHMALSMLHNPKWLPVYTTPVAEADSTSKTIEAIVSAAN